MRDLTLSSSEQLLTVSQTVEEAFHMDEESFRAFYDRTARPLWSYLARLLGDPTAADDLLQETYYRFLRARLPEMDEAYRKNYLFRIATNLMRDHWRRSRGEQVLVLGVETHERAAENFQQRSDLGRAFRCLKPRERQLLWLAYVEGCSHKEIAGVVGLKAASVRLLLFRARQKLAALLRERGLHAGA